MIKLLPKLIGSFVSIFGLALLVSPVFAGTLTNISVDLSNPEQGENTYHTVSFKTDTAASLKYITMDYCKTPSGNCVAPTNLDTLSADKGTLTGFTDSGNWTLDVADDDNPALEHSTGTESVSADTQLTIEMQDVDNNSIAGGAADCLNDGESSSDTCYIRFTTKNGSDAQVDIGTGSYTVVTGVTVTATVDPSFTFVVSGQNTGAVNNGITASVNSTYNTLPFGNLSVGTPKYAAHKLNVTTNTQNGYYIYMRMDNQMTGVYSSNNIDPFGAPSAAWNNPVAWVEPTGATPNDNTGWIGANTTDTDVPNWASASELFGPVNATDNAVMTKATADNGTYSVYVTYALESNVFQPADTYTGTVLYTATPTY
ncbi:hypothetical protein A2W24_02295 [Microgenomates group bacterium RBG_16_45_19]|nr:MAG: hypothetical protein A2W24_02295 [Microgenomates group bacterium RBG_16_45_19]